jgi:hypothetical protein
MCWILIVRVLPGDRVCVCMYVSMCVCMYACTYVCMYVCMYACMYLSMYIRMCMCFVLTSPNKTTHAYLCMYVHMSIHTDVCVHTYLPVLAVVYV